MDFRGYLAKGIELIKLSRPAADELAEDPDAFNAGMLFVAIGGLAGGIGITFHSFGIGAPAIIFWPIVAVLMSFVHVFILFIIAKNPGRDGELQKLLRRVGRRVHADMGRYSAVPWLRLKPLGDTRRGNRHGAGPQALHGQVCSGRDIPDAVYFPCPGRPDNYNRHGGIYESLPDVARARPDKRVSSFVTFLLEKRKVTKRKPELSVKKSNSFWRYLFPKR